MGTHQADPAHRLDRRGVRRAFDRASGSYDAAARLQAAVRAELLDRLQYFTLEPAVVLDLGCGTAHAARELKRRWPRALVVAMDLAPGMLIEARRQSRLLRRLERVGGDACRIPLRTASVDLVFTSLMLQWCDELERVLREIRRVLRAGGRVMLSTFGPDTLRELRAAWSAADEHTHVNRFLDMHIVGDALLQAGFAEPVLDVERHVLEYDDALALMRELKAIGAHNVTAGRAPGLTGRGRLAAMLRAYEAERRNGRLPASFEVVYGTAWAPEARPTAPVEAGEARVPVGALRRRGVR